MHVRPRPPQALLLLIAACLVGQARAYPVGPALSLADLAKEAEVIAKVQAVASQPVEDAWFTPVGGFVATATTLRLVRCFKGDLAEERLTFRHYAPAKEGGPMMYMPQWYQFTAGRYYILFAARTDQPGLFRQMSRNHRSQEDQGLLRAADGDPRRGLSLADAVWAELTGLLRGTDSADQLYALNHLDQMSGGGSSFGRQNDFERAKVIEAVLPATHSRDAAVARCALGVVGARSPLRNMPGDLPYWLATIGKGELPGLGTRDKDLVNDGGRACWRQLAIIVDSQATVSVREAAVLAMVRCGVAELLPMAQRWSRDREAGVRRAAALLLADYPGQSERLRALCRDPEPAAREGGAAGAGCAQDAALLPELGRLLDDRVDSVATVAAMSLLSFDPVVSHDVLVSRLDDANWGCLVVNALAKADAKPYLDRLAKVVRAGLSPEKWWGGRIPWAVSWDLLFRYAQKTLDEEVDDDRLAPVLAALESPADTEPGKSRFYSSSEPRDLYALYLQRGKTERAKAFRAKCKQAIPYDIDIYFSQVDANPGTYTRG